MILPSKVETQGLFYQSTHQLVADQKLPLHVAYMLFLIDFILNILMTCYENMLNTFILYFIYTNRQTCHLIVYHFQKCPNFGIQILTLLLDSLS